MQLVPLDLKQRARTAETRVVPLPQPDALLPGIEVVLEDQEEVIEDAAEVGDRRRDE
jgi:hypothetical protein